MERDRNLADTFVAVVSMLTADFELQDVLEELAGRCATLVEAAAVGVMTIDDAGELSASAASTRDMAELELLEIQRQEGPCYDAFRTGEQVSHEDLTDAQQRWPRFTPRALELGYRSTHGFPLRVRDVRLGALNVFFPEAGPFTDADKHALQALADVAAIGVLQQHTTSRRRVSHERAVVQLGQIALATTPLDAVYEQVCETVTDMLDVSLCQIHELAPSGRLVPRVGVGWDRPLIATDVEPQLPHGRALTETRPIVVEDLSSDDRFDDPTLDAHGVVSGVSAAIPGDPRSVGTLSVYTREDRTFDPDEVTFLGSVATLLGSVVAKHATETQLRRAQKFDAVGQLATGVAHDFNNLLAVIDGNAQLLAMDGTSGPLDAIRTATDQARRQVARLLTFSQQQHPRVEHVDLNEIVTTTVAMVGQAIGRDITVTLELGEGLPPVVVDRSQLEQSIVNLVVNARDAMPDGGTVTLETFEGPELTAGPDARGSVRLVVSDTGVGMSDEVLERAFDPYYTTKGPGKGTGLGLATVYGAVMAVEGRLDVDSAPGRGTTFLIDLPSAADPA